MSDDKNPSTVRSSSLKMKKHCRREIRTLAASFRAYSTIKILCANIISRTAELLRSACLRFKLSHPVASNRFNSPQLSSLPPQLKLTTDSSKLALLPSLNLERQRPPRSTLRTARSLVRWLSPGRILSQLTTSKSPATSQFRRVAISCSTSPGWDLPVQTGSSSKLTFGSPDSPLALQRVEDLIEIQYGARTFKSVPTQTAEEIQTWRIQNPAESEESKESKESNCFTCKGLQQFQFSF